MLSVSKSLTLILILERQLVRMDVPGRRRSQVKGIWRRDRFEAESLAGLTDAALRLGPKRVGDVWVLSGDLWTGVVPVAPDIAGMLDGDELQQALALEAENYSGIPAFESEIGARKLPADSRGNHRWWLTQIPSDQWQDVKRTVEQFGGKWGGMAHPTIVLPPDNPSDSDSWRSIQSFGDTTVAVLGLGNKVVDVLSLGNISTQRTRSQLAEWREETRTEQEVVSWISDGALPAELGTGTDWHLDLSVELANEQLITTWALAAVAGLSTKSNDGVNELPRIAAEVPPMSSERALLISVGLAAVVALGCFGLYRAANNDLTAITAEADRQEQQKRGLAAKQRNLTKRVEVLRKELKAILARNERFDRNLAKASRIRQFGRVRWLKMLNALSQSHGDCWVREINGDHKTAVVHGMAVDVRDVTAFASRLERLASPHGWRVHPARTEFKELPLVHFEIKLDITNDAAKSDAAPLPDKKLVKK